MSDQTTPRDLFDRPHSYRGFEADEFRQAWEHAKGDMEAEHRVRQAFNRMEDGRFDDMLDATHKMFTALDADEREAFAERNPHLLDWVRVWALVSELNRFNDVDYPSELPVDEL